MLPRELTSGNTEQHAAESNRLFQTVFEKMVDGILVAEVKTMRFCAANPSFCRMLGCSLAEVLQLRVHDIHPKESLASTLTVFNKQAAQEVSLARDLPVCRMDGTLFYADVNAFPIMFSGKECLMGVFRDVTERKHVEDRLKESEDYFRSVIEQSSDGIALTDEQGKIIAWNRSLQKATGRPRSEVLGRPLWEIVRDLAGQWAPSYGFDQDFQAVVATACQTGRGPWFDKLYEPEFVRPDGARRCLQVLAYPIQAKNGFRIGIACRDVTRKKAVEEALRESEEKYRTLVESAGETISVVNDEGVFLFMNKMAAACFGGTPEHYIGKTLWDVYPAAVAEKRLACVREVMATRVGVNVVVLDDTRGERRWYNTTVEPLKNAEGKVAAALVIGRDIHDLRKAREELEEYREKMARAEHLASLGTLSATIAHELTQPLTVSRLSLQEAMAQLEVAGCSAEVTEALHETLGGIADATFRVERFRNFARQSSREMPTKVRLGEIVARTVRLLGAKAREGRISLIVGNMDNLAEIIADEKDMEQMCFALMENAIQAADGNERHQLVITGEVAQEDLCLRFEDDCGGVACEHLDRIFQPFFTTKPPGVGTGLGLCIVERIVTQARGKVHVENVPGQGLAVCVALPLQGR